MMCHSLTPNQNRYLSKIIGSVSNSMQGGNPPSAIYLRLDGDEIEHITIKEIQTVLETKVYSTNMKDKLNRLTGYYKAKCLRDEISR